MTDRLATVRERMRQRSEAPTEPLTSAADTGRLDWQRRGGTFVAGDRAFDTLTGQEGTVVAVSSDNLVTRAASPARDAAKPAGFALPTSTVVVTVQLDLGGGRVVPRRPDELVWRPTRPTAGDAKP